MLKAALIAAIGGLVLSRFRFAYACAGVIALTFAEILYVALIHEITFTELLTEYAVIAVTAEAALLIAVLLA